MLCHASVLCCLVYTSPNFNRETLGNPSQCHCADGQWRSLSLVDTVKCLARYAILWCHWAHPNDFQWETPRNEIESVEWSNDGKEVWEALRWRPGKPEERTLLATSRRANLLRPYSHHHQQNHNYDMLHTDDNYYSNYSNKTVITIIYYNYSINDNNNDNNNIYIYNDDNHDHHHQHHHHHQKLLRSYPPIERWCTIYTMIIHDILTWSFLDLSLAWSSCISRRLRGSMTVEQPEAGHFREVV